MVKSKKWMYTGISHSHRKKEQTQEYLRKSFALALDNNKKNYNRLSKTYFDPNKHSEKQHQDTKSFFKCK